MSFPSIFRGSPLGVAPDSRNRFTAMDRLLDEVWRGVGAPATSAPGGFAPCIDVVERESEYLVTAELPGVEEKDVQLEVNRNVLTLAGEKRAEHEQERSGWRWSERSYGSFRRSIQLPVEVATDKASASFRNGVLTITLPKAEHARVRHIPVTSS